MRERMFLLRENSKASKARLNRLFTFLVDAKKPANPLFIRFAGDFWRKLVEMAGVEPASPGLSAETSTRLAARLNFGAS